MLPLLLLVPLVLYLLYQLRLVIPLCPSFCHVHPTPPPNRLPRPEKNRILQRKFNASEIPEKLDAVVIGSGIGGMTIAVCLAKSGYKVVVLEQHSRLGGCCHSFEDRGVEFDAGVHYVGQMSPRTVTRTLFDAITDAGVEWTPMDSIYERVRLSASSQEETLIYSDQSKTIAGLQAQFPAERDAIQTLFDKTNDDGYPCWFFFLKGVPLTLHRLLIFFGVAKYMKILSESQRTFWDVLCERIRDSKLRATLCYFFNNYSAFPWDVSWSMHAATTRHYKHGGYYPEGGCSEIPVAVAGVLERYGCPMFAKANVQEILFNENRRAIGVMVNGQRVLAQYVISDAGVINTFRNLVPRSLVPKQRLAMCEEVGNGEAEFQIFITLRGTKEQLGLKSCNYWLYEDAERFKESLDSLMAIKDLSGALDAGLKLPYLYATFPSAKDPLWEKQFPNGKSTAVVMGIIPWSWFGAWDGLEIGKRGDEYQLLKDRFTHAVMEQFHSRFPAQSSFVESAVMGTPVTAKHYIRAPNGQISGLKHNTARFTTESWLSLRGTTELEGLYLTGQDVALGGVAPAMWGGVIAYAAISRRNPLLDLQLFHKERMRARTKSLCNGGL